MWKHICQGGPKRNVISLSQASNTREKAKTLPFSLPAGRGYQASWQNVCVCVCRTSHPYPLPALPPIPHSDPIHCRLGPVVGDCPPPSLVLVIMILFLPAPSSLEKGDIVPPRAWAWLAQDGTVAVGPKTRKPSRWARVPCCVISNVGLACRLCFNLSALEELCRYAMVAASSLFSSPSFSMSFPAPDKPYSFCLFADRF